MAKVVSCHPVAETKKGKDRGKGLRIALAGNANVGKSVIFNQLTGSYQTIGNWPGKTVESARGILRFEGVDADIIDLPGIYSLSTFSLEELVTREYIAWEKPDVIINVVGAGVLERNLFFTLQLLEMGVPVVVCLNQMDVLESKGMTVDVARLEEMLGVPVLPAVALKGKGIRELVQKAFEVAKGEESKRNAIKFGGVLEASVEELTRIIEVEPNIGYSPRFLAVKLLEGDASIRESLTSEKVIATAEALASHLEEVYGQPRFSVVASERYALASRMAKEVQSEVEARVTFADRLDRFTTSGVFGYIMAFTVILGILLWTFTVGDFLSRLLSNVFSFFQPVDPKVSGPLWGILWNGVFGGFVAGVTLVLPFVIPFYLLLAMMEDSGILTRVAFMMDSVVHQMGLHGKAIIPLILGYGCNVPAIYTTRIMGTRRERLLCAFAITFAPCAARTIVILGLVAVFVGTGWALALYAIDLLVMFVAVKLAMRVIPGETTGLIMEMHSFKAPSFSVVAKQTWARTKSLIYLVFPMYMVGTAAVQLIYAIGALEPINSALTFLTVKWLGLPAIAGILLIFGAVRKELILLTLVAIYGVNLAAVLTPAQFVVLALVGMLYLPCIATIGILAKEFGWRASAAITFANFASALLVGGVIVRVLSFLL